jgi:hypothetical protein
VVVAQYVQQAARLSPQVGTLLVTYGEQQQAVPLIVARDVSGAGIAWKLTRF